MEQFDATGVHLVRELVFAAAFRADPGFAQLAPVALDPFMAGRTAKEYLVGIRDP